MLLTGVGNELLAWHKLNTLKPRSPTACPLDLIHSTLIHIQYSINLLKVQEENRHKKITSLLGI